MVMAKLTLSTLVLWLIIGRAEVMINLYFFNRSVVPTQAGDRIMSSGAYEIFNRSYHP